MDKIIIISVHGICSNIDANDAWQTPFDELIRSLYPAEVASGTLIHLPFSYGIFGPISAWFRLFDFAKSIVTKRFQKFLRTVVANYPGYKIHIVAHSFGTCVVHQTLYDNPDTQITSLHLLGGVISAHIQENYLDEILMMNQLQYCVVWSSHEDIVARFAPPPFGHLGYWGIIRDYTNDRTTPVWQPYEYLKLFNRVTNYGHNEVLIPDVFKIILQDIQDEPTTENA